MKIAVTQKLPHACLQVPSTLKPHTAADPLPSLELSFLRTGAK